MIKYADNINTTTHYCYNKKNAEDWETYHICPAYCVNLGKPVKITIIVTIRPKNVAVGGYQTSREKKKIFDEVAYSMSDEKSNLFER